MNDKKPGLALITGATSGIGNAYARHLASDGYDLLLIARRETLLEELAGELSDKHGINAETMSADLTGEEGIAKVISRIDELGPLSMLINNAGFAVRGKFARSDVEGQVGMIMLHDVCPVRLIHAALPKMMEAERGTVINVSSIMGLLAWPGGSKTYGGSKAFLVNFSDGLYMEVAKYGIQVQVLCPGFVTTGFHKAMGEDFSPVPRFLWMTPEEVVRQSLSALKRKKTVFIPGRRYRLLIFLSRIIPKPVIRKVTMSTRAKIKK